jgi:hypothetical protein
MIIRFKVVRIRFLHIWFVLMRRLTGDFHTSTERPARQCCCNFQG